MKIKTMSDIMLRIKTKDTVMMFKSDNVIIIFVIKTLFYVIFNIIQSWCEVYILSYSYIWILRLSVRYHLSRFWFEWVGLKDGTVVVDNINVLMTDNKQYFPNYKAIHIMKY